MRRTLPLSFLGAAVSLIWASPASAGTLTAQGEVVPFTYRQQILDVTGSASFGDGDLEPIPLDAYQDAGMLFHVGPFAQILPGVMEVGEAVQPLAVSGGNYFPAPIGGGGSAQGSHNLNGGVVTFADPVTRFGATASSESTVYVTVWDQNGAMIGQITWEPDGDAAFIGLDTQGVPIGMLAYGNDDVWNGEAYDSAGDLVVSDSWRWAVPLPCVDASDCENPQNDCVADLCVDGICNYVLTDDAPCWDEDACTVMDTCFNGECIGVDKECDDGIPCTQDFCDGEQGCYHEPDEEGSIGSCCITDDDCDRDLICPLDTNECAPAPDPGDGDGDPTTTSGDGDGDPTTGDGDGDPTTTGDGDPATGDGDGDPTTTGDGDGDPTTTTGGTGETGSSPNVSGDDGCACATDGRDEGVLFGLLGLILLGGIRRSASRRGVAPGRMVR